jgi:hypothetical protein
VENGEISGYIVKLNKGRGELNYSKKKVLTMKDRPSDKKYS